MDKAEMNKEDKETDFRESEKTPFCLKIARVVSVREHPNAEKLYVLRIDVGDEERILVAGLRGRIPEEEIVGTNIVVVANLKPKVLRGIESRGMLLAASKGNRIVLLRAEGIPGEELQCNGFESQKEELSIEEFARIKFEVRDKKIFYNGFPISSSKGFVIADIEDGAEVK